MKSCLLKLCKREGECGQGVRQTQKWFCRCAKVGILRAVMGPAASPFYGPTFEDENFWHKHDAPGAHSLSFWVVLRLKLFASASATCSH